MASLKILMGGIRGMSDPYDEVIDVLGNEEGDFGKSPTVISPEEIFKN